MIFVIIEVNMIDLKAYDSNTKESINNEAYNDVLDRLPPKRTDDLLYMYYYGAWNSLVVDDSMIFDY